MYRVFNKPISADQHPDTKSIDHVELQVFRLFQPCTFTRISIYALTRALARGLIKITNIKALPRALARGLIE